MRIGTYFFKSVEQGAETPTYLATAPELESVTGKYFVNKEPTRAGEEAYDQSIATRLWEVSAELTGLA